jgi:hypothetical protein
MVDKEAKPVEIRRLADLEAEFKKFLLIKDPGIISLLVDVVVANQMDMDPVWLFLIAPSSGGKSELIVSVNDILNEAGDKIVFPISDLTSNTFASGQKRTGKETSLLFKMPLGGILTFKDFTSLLSKNEKTRAEIVGQLREIYDKEYTKRTGTGDDIVWRGKLGAIAGATEIIHEYEEEFSSMGARFIMYSVVQPQRRDVLNFVMEKKKDKTYDKEKMRQHLRACMKSYVEFLIDNIEDQEIKISPQAEKDLMDVADFATIARSGVVVNKFKGNVEFVPSAEMPTRMIDQLLALASAMLVRHNAEPASKASKDELTIKEYEILHKIAFDSIPLKRRMALKILAQYRLGITTRGLATSINYQTTVAGAWLSQLNGLGVVTRESHLGGQGDVWKLKPEYQKIMAKFEHIKIIEGEVLDAADTGDAEADASWSASRTQDEEYEIQRQAEIIDNELFT